ncbi:MAG: 16S rRNA (cytosine(967)-C(5))-methyltransferase RsmB [Ruminococcaceae bacterium]|nr:16S rRNA (cytosine(967)-C(5))-methyltransferase RsmB [Oscillospiraceae bacterium]
MKSANVRKLALDSLIKCTRQGRYSNLEVMVSLSRNTLDTRDKSLYTALVYGVIEREITLDHIISKFSKIPFEKLDFEVIVILRLSIYQIMYMDRIPDFSACDEGVKLSPHSAKAFVNALLRNLIKNKETVEKELEKAPLSLKYSVPEWIVELWKKGYGEKKAEEILEGFLIKPPMTLRTNTLKITTEELFAKLKETGVKCNLQTNTPDVITVQGSSPETLWGFDEGFFFVQGTNSKIAVSALELTSGKRVIDVCACPGGKSFSAAIDMKNEGELFSFDLHENKLSLIDKGAKRLKIDIIKTEKLNATAPKEELFGTADAVICDVPCSGLGIIAKKPDIKYKKYEEVKNLYEKQLNILSASSLYLKKGGKLLYSTCTLNPEENEKITEKFLLSHSDFRRLEGYPKTAFPSKTSDDGFFHDLLIKD